MSGVYVVLGLAYVGLGGLWLWNRAEHRRRQAELLSERSRLERFLPPEQ